MSVIPYMGFGIAFYPLIPYDGAKVNDSWRKSKKNQEKVMFGANISEKPRGQLVIKTKNALQINGMHLYFNKINGVMYIGRYTILYSTFKSFV